MTRVLVLGGSGLLWAVMMAALVRQEVLPYFEYQAPPSYRGLLKELTHHELTTADILAAGVKVGQLETLAEPMFEGGYRIRMTLEMRARMLGRIDPESREKGTDEMPVSLKSTTTIDALYRLSSTNSQIDLGFGLTTFQSKRVDDRLNVSFDVRIGNRRLAGGSQTIDFPREGMVGDLFQPFPGGGSLFIGKKWRIPTMTADLTGPKLSWLYAAVTDRETIIWKDQPVDTYRVEIRTEPTEEKRPTHISWCREDGVALKQQMTYLTLVYEIVMVERKTVSRQDAFRWNRDRFGHD